MRLIANKIALCLVLAFFVSSAGALAQAPDLLSSNPVQNALGVSTSTGISVTFDTDMDAATINGSSFIVHARFSGPHDGTISYDPGTRTASFDPDVDFADGEVVSVTLTEDITSSLGAPLTNGFGWTFTIEAGACSGIFVDGPEYLIGNNTLSFLKGVDLNSDNNIDLVVPRSGTWSIPGSKVAVLMNNGDGSFAAPVDYNVASYPLEVASADLNGDGFLDVVTNNWFARNVSVLFGDGTGALVTRNDYPVSHAPNSITAADFNGDGHIDIVTGSRIYHTVAVLLNNGDGTFRPPTLFPTNAYTVHVVARDFDGDGDFDLACSNNSASSISILMNNGDATFQPPAIYPTGGFRAGRLRAADYNQDGYVDIATANVDGHSIGMLLNDGDGTFTLDGVYPTPNNPMSVQVGDVDGDGDLDLISPSKAGNCASVFINDGNGVLAPPINYPVGDYPRWIVAADLNGNGGLDLAVVSFNSPTVSILWNTCVPGYTPAGSDVEVALTDSISVIFENVETPGVTEIVVSGTGTPPPDGFKILPMGSPVYYEIVTSAVFSGEVTICFIYDEANVTGQEKNLRLLHRTDGKRWMNITVSLDTEANKICGLFTALVNAKEVISLDYEVGSAGFLKTDIPAPFVFGGICCFSSRGNVNADMQENVNISDISYLVDYLFGVPLGSAPSCPAAGNVNGDVGGNTNISDITYLVDYLFGVPLGPEPPECP